MKATVMMILVVCLILGLGVEATQEYCVNGKWGAGNETGWTRWRAGWGSNEQWSVPTASGNPAPCGKANFNNGQGSFGWFQRITNPPVGSYTVHADWQGNIGGAAGWMEVMFFAVNSGTSDADVISRIDGGNAIDISYKKDSWGMNPPTAWSWQAASLSPHPSGNNGTITKSGTQDVIVGLKLGHNGNVSTWGEWDNISVLGPVTTFALIASFGAFEEGGEVVVRWTAAASSDTAGFYLERWDGAVGDYVRIAPDLIVAAEGSGIYECVDPGAEVGTTYAYRLIEMTTTGETNAYGPYEVTVGPAIPSYEEWAALMFPGITDPAIIGPDADPDGDGQTNHAEWAAGTDPRDPASKFRITSIAPSPVGSVLTWTSAAGRRYVVETAPGPRVAFTPLFSEGLAATPPENVFTGTVDAATALFRIVVIYP